MLAVLVALGDAGTSSLRALCPKGRAIMGRLFHRWGYGMPFLPWLIWISDETGHKLGWTPRWLCLAADISVGWDPSCADWNESANCFHRWLYRHYYDPARLTDTREKEDT